jgi:antitoxin CptB
MKYNRVLWASRRGMLELDLILRPFAEFVYPHLSGAEQKLYRQLLDCEDQDLFAWLVRRKVPTDGRSADAVKLVLDNLPSE